MKDEIINALLETLIETGAFVDFYGAANNEFRLGVHGTLVTFLVKEDEQDGYRSSMDGVYHPDPDDSTIFFDSPIAQVQVIKDFGKDSYSAHEFWHLRDRDGHEWLTWGTDNCDDYYPSFTFNYEPKAGVQ